MVAGRHDHGSCTNAVPVTIITGFLGSGKTTVLNRLLKLPSLADTAVIVNEFGAVGLDHLLIEQAIEDAVLLKNGCICCTVRGDIADTLETLWQRREAGALPPFRRIAIETTGLADPAPVAHALLAAEDATLCLPAGRHRHDGGCAARRDAARTAAGGAPAGGDGGSHVAHQDRPGERRRHRFGRGADRGVERPARRCGMWSMATWTASDVFDLGPGDGANDARVAQWLQRVRRRSASRSSSSAVPAWRRDRLGGVAARPADRLAGVAAWLESVLSLRGDDVLRLKGLVRLVGRGSADRAARRASRAAPAGVSCNAGGRRAEARRSC